MLPGVCATSAAMCTLRRIRRTDASPATNLFQQHVHHCVGVLLWLIGVTVVVSGLLWLLNVPDRLLLRLCILMLLRLLKLPDRLLLWLCSSHVTGGAQQRRQRGGSLQLAGCCHW